jgi:hypothetical protein
MKKVNNPDDDEEIDWEDPEWDVFIDIKLLMWL